jgi:hypothetical protein
VSSELVTDKIDDMFVLGISELVMLGSVGDSVDMMTLPTSEVEVLSIEEAGVLELVEIPGDFVGVLETEDDDRAKEIGVLVAAASEPETIELGRYPVITVEDTKVSEFPVLGSNVNGRLGEPFKMTGLPVIEESDVLEDEEVVSDLVFVVNSTGLSPMEVEAGSEVEVDFPAELSSLAPQTPLFVIPALMAFFI